MYTVSACGAHIEEVGGRGGWGRRRNLTDTEKQAIETGKLRSLGTYRSSNGSEASQKG